MGKSILIVDNDRELFEINKKALESEGFQVQWADSSKEALEKLNESRPDLILTEVTLEHSDSGFSFCFLAKQKYSDVPIVILSDVVRKTGISFDLSTEEEKEWIKADEFLYKPINPANLVCRLKKHI